MSASDSKEESVTSYFLVEHPIGVIFGVVTHPKYHDPIEQVKLAWGHAARYTRMRAEPDHNLLTLRLDVKLPRMENGASTQFTH